jgi:steroid 5-alpha reductase family enzyme
LIGLFGASAGGPWAVAATGLFTTAVLALLTWAVSLARRDVSLVDRVWSLMIVAAGLAYAALLPAQSNWRGPAMLAVAGVWALRLSAYISWRNWGHGEDRRYQAIRARNQPHFEWKSLYLVFALQAVLAWVVAMPFLAALQGARPPGWIDMVGLALAVFGVVFEAVGDAQMARFKADAAHRGQVMDRGLWRYTRHPNYFGEACVWWGLWLMAASSGGWGGLAAIVSPLLMTVLLLKVSGVRLLEQDLRERSAGYRDYIARTNAFVPGPPRPAGR